MEETTYLFIDGGYLNGVVKELFVPIFGDGFVIDFATVKRECKARKAFYYDCLDSVPKQGESKTDFDARVEGQRGYFDEIRSVAGMHVREGWLTTGKKRQQKEVDVQLAVDMLTHAFQKNMTKAVLLAGDRDFKPLVNSLVQYGTYVEILHDSRTASSDLLKSGDLATRINVEMLCGWMKLEEGVERTDQFPVVNQHDMPKLPLERAIFGQGHVKKAGNLQIGKRTARVALVTDDSRSRFAISITAKPGKHLVYKFGDWGKLEKYVASLHGEIKWEGSD